MSHLDVHPQPEEGCRECAGTPRPFPWKGRTIEEVLRSARIHIPEPTEEEVTASMERLRRDWAAYQADLDRLRRDLDDWNNGGIADGA